MRTDKELLIEASMLTSKPEGGRIVNVQKLVEKIMKGEATMNDSMVQDFIGKKENPHQSGTEWTAPGQGATVKRIVAALSDMDPAKQTAFECAAWNCALSHLPAGSADAVKNLRRTNLRLTGSPLTAEDLKRIAECEVSR